MKVLLIKVSSMGDVIHSLPALTDAVQAIKGVSFDWVVEEAFAEIPGWHPAVDKIIPVAMRRWRKSPLNALTNGEWRRFKERLKARQYDAVIDAQGLLKTAFLTRLSRGPSFGLNKHSAREPVSSRLYENPQQVCWNQHAVERVRHLLAQSLGYEVPDHIGRFLLERERFDCDSYSDKPYVVFIHGTTRHNKHWPEPYWCELANHVNRSGLRVLLPWGNPVEKARAERIALASEYAEVLPKSSLSRLAGIISHAAGVVSVDTGLGHLTAALDKPAVSLYGPTSPARIGAYGTGQIHLTLDHCPPGDFPAVDPDIFSPMTPDFVWSRLKTTL
ncbi:lipopolysaccharide heptosyltransferase I [Candidatus Sororendozoicomonas aggregata]|uniref:lipopolysaccharide heptosyltransferase I n=1 Tax=Candidatus Sororendozoicomonas aggregata TaxID=3073239 RepID=UPI002ED459EB